MRWSAVISSNVLIIVWQNGGIPFATLSYAFRSQIMYRCIYPKKFYRCKAIRMPAAFEMGCRPKFLVFFLILRNRFGKFTATFVVSKSLARSKNWNVCHTMGQCYSEVQPMQNTVKRYTLTICIYEGGRGAKKYATSGIWLDLRFDSLASCKHLRWACTIGVSPVNNLPCTSTEQQ